MEGLISFLLFAGFIYFMMRFGCGAHTVHGRDAGHGADSRHKDPVCGMDVDPEQGYGKMQEGTLYRFCSRHCLDGVDTAPERYLLSKEAEGKSWKPVLHFVRPRDGACSMDCFRSRYRD